MQDLGFTGNKGHTHLLHFIWEVMDENVIYWRYIQGCPKQGAAIYWPKLRRRQRTIENIFIAKEKSTSDLVLSWTHSIFRKAQTWSCGCRYQRHEKILFDCFVLTPAYSPYLIQISDDISSDICINLEGFLDILWSIWLVAVRAQSRTAMQCPAHHFMLRPGGKQARLRDGWFIKDGKTVIQPMIFPDTHPTFPNIPKGMKQVLIERGSVERWFTDAVQREMHRGEWRVYGDPAVSGRFSCLT